MAGEDGEKHFETVQVCGGLDYLKEYGLGVYLYLKFMQELLIACFLISIINILPLYTFYTGAGLSDYPDSFTLTLAKFTQGNLVLGDQVNYYTVIGCDILTMLVMFGFYIRWRSVHNEAVEQSDKDHTILNPTLYVVSVSGFDPNTPDLEKNLKGYFDALFHGAYEVEIVHNFKRNFSKFIDLEEQI